MEQLPGRSRKVNIMSSRGKWLTNELHVKECLVRKRNRFGRYSRPKRGWELLDYLIYKDMNDIVWVAEPGYVWDGSSYPDALNILVGRREKEGLLAASAHHDQMLIRSDEMYMYALTNNLDEWEEAIADKTISRFIKFQPLKQLRISIPHGAILYKHMALDWANADETVSTIKAIKQFVGLIIFQPWYSFFTGNTIWEKVEGDK